MSNLWVHNASAEVNAASQYPEILGACISLTAIMIVAIGLRGYVRGYMLKMMGWDDWVIIFSGLCAFIYSGLAIGQSRWGLGLPLLQRPADDIGTYSVINFAGRPFYMIGILGFKVSICLSYLRVLEQSNRIYRLSVWGIMALCILGHLVGTLVLLFQCKPTAKSWIPGLDGTCLPNDVTFYSLAAMTILFDVVILILPVPVLLDLQINGRRKLALLFVFTLGIFTTVCSILRMVQIGEIAKSGNSTMLVLWGTIEMNVGIILTCIPTLTPLFKYYREKSTSRSRFGYNQPQAIDGTVIRGGSDHTSNMRSKSRGEWSRRDSLDNSSQKNILGMNSSPEGLDNQVYEMQPGEGGITATTIVEVSVTNLGSVKPEEVKDYEKRW